MSKSQVFVAQRFWVICRNVSRTFAELCMETPYWCTVLVHQYGRRKSTKTSGVHFFYKSSFFHSITRIRAHKNIFSCLEWLYCWKSRGDAFFQRDSIPILVSRTVKPRRFKLLYFRNETCYGNGNLYKNLFFVYL